MKYIIPFFFIAIHFVGAQSYTPLQFDELQPVWTHYAKAENIDSLFDYLPRSPLIVNDKIYFTYNIQKHYYDGWLLEKVNLNSGEIDWKTQYFSDNLKDREYGQSPYMKDGKLGLLTFREIPFDFAGAPYWRKAFMVSRQINDENGFETSVFVADTGRLMEIVSHDFNDMSLPVLLPYADDLIQYIQLKGQNHQSFTSFFLDMKGEPVDQSYEIKYLPLLDRNRPFGFSRLDNGFLVTSHAVEIQKWTKPFTLEMRIFSKDWKQTFIKDISEFVTPSIRFDLQYAHSSNFLLAGQNRQDWITDEYDKTGYFHFDIEGNLLENVEIVNIDNVNNFHTGIGFVRQNKKILIACTSDDLDGYQNLYFLESNGMGQLDTIKQLKCNNLDDKFYCRKLIELENGDLLINLAHILPNTGTEIIKSVWMRFSKEEIFTSNADLKNQTISFYIFPNPTSHTIKITPNTKIQPKSIQIFNTIGQKIKSIPYQSTLDLSHFEKGIYFIQLHGENGVSLGVQRVVLY